MINNNLHNVLQLVNNHSQSTPNDNIKIACNIDKFSGTLFFDSFDDINYISQQVQSDKDTFSYARNDGLLTINFRWYSSYGFKITLSEYYKYIRFSFSSKMLRMMKNESDYLNFIEEFFTTINFNISRNYIKKFLKPSLVEVHVDIFGHAPHRDWIIARKLLINNVLDDKAVNERKARINKYYDGGYETLTINKNNKPLLIKEMLEIVGDNDVDRLCSSVKIYDKFYDMMVSKYGHNRHWLKVYGKQLFGFNPDEIDYFIDLYSKLTIKERQQIYNELSSRIGITRYEFTLTGGYIKKLCGYKKNPLSEIYTYNIQNCIDFKNDLMLYLINNIWSISKKTRISNRWKLIPVIGKTINLLRNDNIIKLQPTRKNEEEEKMGKASNLNKNTRGLKGRLRTIQKDIYDLFTSGYDVNDAINDLRQSENILTAIFDNIIRYNQSHRY
jgi:hypothetical protein